MKLTVIRICVDHSFSFYRLSLLVANISALADANKPNIIFILADDLGYGDVGCYGQKRIKTPSIDRMAAEGMRFTQCYAGAPFVRRRAVC